MRQTLLFIFFFLLSAQFLEAQTSLKAKQLLDEVSKNMGSYENIYFEFTYALNNRKENIRQETKGDLTVAGEKYKLNYLDAIQILDGEKLYTIVPENEEVTIAGAEEEESGFGINPRKLLSFYQSGYDYQWDVQQNVKGRNIQYVKLIPSNENEGTQYLLLGVDTKGKHIYKLIEIGRNGTRTTLTINRQETNLKLQSDFFAFDATAYPDYYIIE